MLKYLLDTNIAIYVIKRRPLIALERFNRERGGMAAWRHGTTAIYGPDWKKSA